MLLFLVFSLSDIKVTTSASLDMSSVGVHNSSLFTVSDNDIIAASEGSEGVIVLTNFQGQRIKRLGRKGEGPGKVDPIV